jgi:hypothetical protein
MKTYEMVALADKDGKTYQSGEMYYQKDKGFHDEFGREWEASAYNCENGLSRFIHEDEWELVAKRKMTIQEIEDILGYNIEIV